MRFGTPGKILLSNLQCRCLCCRVDFSCLSAFISCIKLPRASVEALCTGSAQATQNRLWGRVFPWFALNAQAQNWDEDRSQAAGSYFKMVLTWGGNFLGGNACWRSWRFGDGLRAPMAVFCSLCAGLFPWAPVGLPYRSPCLLPLAASLDQLELPLSLQPILSHGWERVQSILQGREPRGEEAMNPVIGTGEGRFFPHVGRIC